MILTWWLIAPVLWVPVRVPQPMTQPPIVKQQTVPLPALTWTA
jgi:hypothetical protein